MLIRAGVLCWFRPLFSCESPCKKDEIIFNGWEIELAALIQLVTEITPFPVFKTV